jgi:DNA-directed RNA polymerase subunit M/transcription elongation factor TFIIS
MLHVTCPDCANPLKVSADSIGETVTCPACGQSFRISEPGPKPPELVPQVVLQPVTEGDEDNDADSESDVETPAIPAAKRGSVFTRQLSPRAFLIMGVFVLFILIPIFLSGLGNARRQSDDELRERLEERSREAYFKQLNEAQKARKN